MGVRTPSYQAGFYAPERGGRPAYPQAWRGCVGAWNPGLGPSGLVLRDWGGRKNHGTLTNGPVWSTSTGQQAISFDGVNDYVALSSPVPIDLLRLASNPFTLSASLRISAFATQGDGSWNLFTIGGSSDYRIISFGTYAARLVILASVSGGSWNIFLQGATTLVTGITYAVSYRRSGNGVYSVLLNGRLDGSATNTGSLVLDDSTAKIATHYNLSASRYSSGSIMATSFHDRALSASEISLLARRPGIAYELAPRRFYSLPTPSFSAAWARRQSIIIGGGLH